VKINFYIWNCFKT